MSVYRELMRRKLFEEIYEKMSPEERNAFAQLTTSSKNHDEIMEAIRMQGEQISHISDSVDRRSWITDFGSDVAANFFTDGIIWLGSRIAKKL